MPNSLVTLESDKATMDVPSPSAGTVKALNVKVGDKVKEGTLILTLDSAAGASEAAAKPASPPASAPPPQTSPTAAAERAPRGEKGLADTPGEGPTTTPPEGKSVEVRVPDIGDFSDVPVIEIFVKPGDVVKVDDPLVTLESDKATMDVPSPVAGAVQGVRVSVGDRVSEGSVIATVAPSGEGVPASAAALAAAPSPQPSPASGRGSTTASAPASLSPLPPGEGRGEGNIGSRTGDCTGRTRGQCGVQAAHASPRCASSHASSASTCRRSRAAVRTAASARGRARLRETGTRCAFICPAPGTGGAIAGGGTLNLLPWPKVDFAKFGPVEAKPLSRIKKISGQNLARNWVMIPHVTQFDEADITDLEALRVQLNKEHEKAGVKFTMLAFLIKGCVSALKKFPDFNSSLEGDNLVYKQYYNIGFAADRRTGSSCRCQGRRQKGLVAIAKEMRSCRKGARSNSDLPTCGRLDAISSLGGIGARRSRRSSTPGVRSSCEQRAHETGVGGKAFAPKLISPIAVV